MMRIQGASDGNRGRPHSRNKTWVAGGQPDSKNGHMIEGERREHGGHRRRGRGRGQEHHGTHLTVPTDIHDEGASATEDEGVSGVESAHDDEPEHEEIQEPEHIEDRDEFYKELVRQREVERKKAIAEGKMDDPLVPKRLEDAITMVGTCMGMCPRFERYRRERENNLDKWELIPGTKRVDHKRAVKIYERAAGDKTLPSDLRPPPALKKTLDYLFHKLLVKEGFSQTHDFIRDRSRAVRTDFTMQHETGALAIECHDRCARYHILALHLERENPRFSVALEEQQLMYTLTSLKEFYEDQRGRYQAPTELEMRVYHRLIHIRDQRERHEEIPDEIRNHPVFILTTQFRLRVQAKSAPITKTSKLVVDNDAMQIFSQLATVLREQNNVVMIYLVACIMERLFGKECIEDIEAIRGELTISEIIDGISKPLEDTQTALDGGVYTESPAEGITDMEDEPEENRAPPLGQPVAKSATQWLTNNPGAQPQAPTAPPPQDRFALASIPAGSGTSAFAGLASEPFPNSFGSESAFGTSGSAFASSAGPPASVSAFGNLMTKSSAFGGATFGPAPSASSAPTSVFGSGTASMSVFGAGSKNVFGTGASTSPPFSAPSTSTSGPPPAAAPLTSQPTWPAESSTFGGVSAAPAKSAALSGPTAPRDRAAALNPFAATFMPPQSNSTGPSTGFTPALGPTQPTPAQEKPSSLFSTTIFSTPSAAPAASPAKASGGIFSVPLFPPQQRQQQTPPTLQYQPTIPPPVPTEPSSPVAPEQPLATPSQTPSRIIERRQTLWDLPGSSSPFSRLKEERLTFTPTPGNAPEPRTPISPTAEPPALGKLPHLDLPPTPTARWFDPGSAQGETSDLALSRKRSLLHFPSLTLPTPSAAEILSPIHLTTPTPSKNAPAATGDPSPLHQSHVPEPAPSAASTSTSTSMPPPPPKSRTPPGPRPVLGIQTNGIVGPELSAPNESVPTSTNGKGKAKETQVDLDAKAADFLRTSALVRGRWTRWRARMAAEHEWEEACKRSEAYKSRVSGSATSHLGPSESAREQSKKRRISTQAEVQEKRAKRRRSKQFEKPLTDEALARRLQENREENEKRWAQGSFHQTVLERLKTRLEPGDELQDWCLWVSMNTENDNTAVWVERKFDVPSSGYWVSENVFSIPTFNKPEGQGSPGLIVFERTPLDGVDDEIEKKYRVIDDCARLRDVLEALPPTERRHYSPCLLVVDWSDDEDTEQTRDLVDMTHRLVKEGTVKHVSYFKVASTVKDLDKKFADTIDVTPLDIDDRLAIALDWKDIKRLFVAPVLSAISDLLDTSWPDNEFDWVRYNQVMSAIGEILNAALHAILSMFNHTPTHVTVEIPEDIPQPGVTGREYASGAFAESLANLLFSSAKELAGSHFSSGPVLFPKDVVDAARRRVESAINKRVDKLRHLAADAALRASVSSVGPSPKRRASDDDYHLNSSMSSKRLRRSPSDDGIIDVDGDETSTSPPPSISAATDMSDKPLVTVAMLRALTRNVLKTYNK
ncbi:SAC3/GANP/Nin1/mts3/eIF-3 p25 family-domain-containing protein [Ganoderma leucocontextum]|nr:SAC3/GANP/Nin1/mts3/eIF-3 p25 family-domain-containing protein [Ganoderma leucocontextum]